MIDTERITLDIMANLNLVSAKLGQVQKAKTSGHMFNDRDKQKLNACRLKFNEVKRQADRLFSLLK